MAGVPCCRMLSHTAKIISTDLVLLLSNGIICLNSPVVCPAASVRLLDECREDPDWTDEFTVADLVQKYAAGLKTALSMRGHLILSLLLQRSHNTELLIAMGGGV